VTFRTRSPGRSECRNLLERIGELAELSKTGKRGGTRRCAGAVVRASGDPLLRGILKEKREKLWDSLEPTASTH